MMANPAGKLGAAPIAFPGLGRLCRDTEAYDRVPDNYDTTPFR